MIIPSFASAVTNAIRRVETPGSKETRELGGGELLH